MTKQEVKREQTLTDMANKIAKLDKEYELLGKRCNQLLKDKGALLDRIKELEKENARLKDGIALKDEEVGCIETDFNTFKSKAKEIITELLKYTDTEAVEMIKEAKQFLSEV